MTVCAFYTTDPEKVLPKEEKYAWKVKLGYQENSKRIVAYIDLVELERVVFRDTTFITETSSFRDDDHRCIEICDINQMKDKSLGKMQENLNRALKDNLGKVLNCTSEIKEIGELLTLTVRKLASTIT